MDPGGKMGAYALLSMFGLPLKINVTIREQYPGATNVQTVGFPALSFMHDDEMTKYVDYMNMYISHSDAARRELEAAAASFARMKPEDKGQFAARTLHPGGWPLETRHRNGRNVIVRFGFPPLPIMMEWGLQRCPVYYVTLQGFRVNTGQLPLLVQYQLRLFQNALGGADGIGELEQDVEADIVLTDQTSANPYNVTTRYYGAACNPLEVSPSHSPPPPLMSFLGALHLLKPLWQWLVRGTWFLTRLSCMSS